MGHVPTVTLKTGNGIGIISSEKFRVLQEKKEKWSWELPTSPSENFKNLINIQYKIIKLSQI